MTACRALLASEQQVLVSTGLWPAFRALGIPAGHADFLTLRDQKSGAAAQIKRPPRIR